MTAYATARLPPLRALKAAARSGDSTAAHNIPIAYRDAGNLRRAVFWWQRFASDGDGEAALDVGYAYQYGLGARRAPQRAMQALRQALRSRDITEYGREEAAYHLAVLTLDRGGSRRQVLTLLCLAKRDGDYPEAARLAAAVEAGRPIAACRCRRGRWRSIRGQAACARHRQPRRS
ncbi:MAG: hypothetical protein SF182_06420 [Deltaproteobacteria bacterium]|nr:hypothetical protein [Deltaproteobacteria bacterium]